MKKLRFALLIVTCGFSAAIVLYSVASGVAKLRSAAVMVESANRFLAALNQDQRGKAVFRFDDEERLNWHFIPRARKGLPIKEMTEDQRKLAHAFLKSGFGQKGYLKATTIMDLEPVLREIEKGTGPVRDPELYYFSVFGEPTLKGPWGWRVEGHHISFNFTVVDGAMVATTPGFFGANPAEVREGPKQGLRALAAEEDLARALLRALDEKQRTQAVFNQVAPNDIVSFNSKKADPLAPDGVQFNVLNARQRKMLEGLIDEYLTRMPEDVAGERREKLRKAGLEKVYFAWAGSGEPKSPHYYRVQGPTFLIEYDDTQNNANHIHSVWRDFDGDFGRDLLREHYQNSPHGK